MRKIAIVGMSCNLPGNINNLDKLLGALRERRVTAGAVPEERWDMARYYSSDEASKGKAYVEKGNFLQHDIRSMDAEFFDLPASVAENIDPQQRLLLELTWEAFENAGLDLPAHSGRKVGVYVGGFMLDQMITMTHFANRTRQNANTPSGMMMTMLANRLSHAFNLRGPSLSIDTACSSSLVAFSYACNDIWSGECDMAVVGGANIMTRPEYPIGMCKGHFLSRDGQCKSFDARGDGYGRGEGGGVVIVKALEQALLDGDTILATVEGAGVNSDGRTPGISMPSAEAQGALIQDICTRFDIDPAQVRYVECHGTGTAAGDPIEARSIGSVYGKGRTGGDRVVLGSIKSNIGHLEAGAGIASLIKAVLTLQHREAFELGNLETPNPDIPFEEWGIQLAAGPIQLAKPGEAFLVGVNSFGFGGTNAHVVLRSAPDTEPATVTSAARSQDAPLYLPFSARSPGALKELSHRYSERLQASNVELDDILHSAAFHRAPLNHRAVAIGRDREQLHQALSEYWQHGHCDQVITSRRTALGKPLPVWVFTGMGPQWWGMGQELYRSEPVYRDAVDTADRLFQNVSGFSIVAEMLKSKGESRITQTAFAQPANFMIQWGLAAMLSAAGVKPGAIVGHSVGEVTAACVSGALSLDDAVRVIHERSRLQATTAGTGSMLAVGVGQKEAQAFLAGYEGRIEVAAVNGPNMLTLSGETAAIETLAQTLETQEIFNRLLTVEVPYHSYLMTPILDELTAALRSISACKPSVPLVSTVTGCYASLGQYGTDYWQHNVRQPVHFYQAIQTLLDDDYVTFIEIGPHPVLAGALRDCAKVQAKEIRLVETLRREEPEQLRMQRVAAQVFASGCEIDWQPFNGRGRFTDLPNYPWQREHLWLESERSTYMRVASTQVPMLGVRHYPANDVWLNDLGHQALAYLKEHVVSGVSIMPAAGYVETLLEAAAALYPDNQGLRLSDLEIRAPLVISSNNALDYVSTYSRDSGRVTLHSIESGSIGEGQVHAVGRVDPLATVEPQSIDIAEFKASFDSEWDLKVFYRELSRIGLQYGPMFQTIRSIRADAKSGRALTFIECSSELSNQGYHAHPTVLDACFQSLVGLLEDSDTTYLPTGFRELRLLAPTLPARCWCKAVRASSTAAYVESDLTITDEHGVVVAEIRGMRVTAVPSASGRTDKFGDPIKLQMARYEWADAGNPPEPKRLGNWLIVEDDSSRDLATRIVEDFHNANVSVSARLRTGPQERADGLEISVPLESAAIEQALGRMGPLAGVVFVHGAQARLDSQDPIGAQALLFMIEVSRCLARLELEHRPRAYVITHNAFKIMDNDAPVQPAQTALAGFARVAFNEIEGVRFSSVDLPATPSAADINACLRELICDAPQDEVAIRHGRRFSSRLEVQPWLADALVEDVALASMDMAVLVRPDEDDNSLGSVKLIETPRGPLGADEIELKVQRVVVSKHDLQAAGQPPSGQNYIEVLATVTRTGADIADLHPGQRVYGLAPSTFTSHLRGPRSAFHLTSLNNEQRGDRLLLVAVRDAIAQHLIDQASLEAGLCVLIEADPLGLAIDAALQRRGVRTVLIHVPDNEAAVSTSTAIAATRSAVDAAVCEHTAGKGFDAIIGSMPRWDRLYGWEALALGGGLIDTEQTARAFALPGNAASLVRADLALISQRAELFAASLRTAVERASQSQGPVIPSLTISIADLATKKFVAPDNVDIPVIIDFDEVGSTLKVQVMETVSFKPDASYLVTGGFGGFGQKTSRWLVDHGARHIVLAGRSGADTPERLAFVEELRQQGANVLPLACDLADASAVRDLMGTIADSAAPLRGVFHLATVIIDEAIIDLDPANFLQVMQSKAQSALLLHQATQEIELDHFVLFSSFAGLIGNSKQASYVSANCFLDGLTWHRRALGLPALSINWGAISDTGIIARDEKLEQFMRYMGLRGMETREALQWLERAMRRDITQLGISLISSWADWAQYETLSQQSPRFIDLIASDTEASNDASERLREEIAALPETERFAVLSGLIVSLIADELEASTDTVSIDRPILEFGIDSLMAAEIQVVLKNNLGISVSVIEILNNLTIRGMANDALANMGLSDDLDDEPSTAVQAQERQA
ncbi:Acyl transferase domain-containing protein [Pseudomonas sp. NFPP10]|uniref:type I polyketide synthase n=1 Tax=unclassified Pseudomonas TaxID=196821 RepID=UPI0008891831|nr:MULTISPECIES: type I polyketide synthase [unclassified Pseudomonas]PZP06938.1 MAG: KR domain-containing protein [Pseudomonas protegens]SDA22943.1 Acyl transferase domain-containing protein [Pseudomonas sp. NFPP12]SEL51478.1 Acyl transferase domain-containing protein [Pseudomonas sp. NFPP10]SEQ40103.1 Acyl transferase domain-containing protein [Pseudomonas sp. NFPP19]SFJ19006.1 Acyl transferase domain-containing protein [Pseudomonas sp. NFPP08]